MPDRQRFRNNQETIETFADEFLVVCPVCAGRAIVRPAQTGQSSLFAPRRLICPACGHSRESASNVARFGDAHDSYFGLPLWLQTPVGDQVLWAYNPRHLDLLEAYVRATLRERRADSETGWRNSSIVSRLPAWITSAKNRPRILRAITRIRRKLEP